MPIELPDLDNKTFSELMDEMIASVPKYTKEWTNFNPSDPGVAILELLAWISETLIYRANTVSTEAYLNFLRLVSGDTVFDDSDEGHAKIMRYVKGIENGTEKPDLHAMKGAAQSFLNSRYRAVTEEDFRQLAMAVSQAIRRVEIIAAPNAVAVVLVPSGVPGPEESADLCGRVTAYLKPRRLLGTVVNVLPATYTPVSLKIEVICYSYASKGTVEETVKKALRDYLDPVLGGPLGRGWPYGRDVIVYELCNVIENVAGVKTVSSILSPDSAFPIRIEGLVDNRETKSFIEVKVTGEHEGVGAP